MFRDDGAGHAVAPLAGVVRHPLRPVREVLVAIVADKVAVAVHAVPHLTAHSVKRDQLAALVWARRGEAGHLGCLYAVLCAEVGGARVTSLPLLEQRVERPIVVQTTAGKDNTGQVRFINLANMASVE